MTTDWSPPTNKEAVQEQLLQWYERNHRSFPWRETDNPYQILVSEVMSQQTQLSRVEDAWTDFIDRWPTVNDLADDTQSNVVSFWTSHSLGYNNRAKWLHQAAQQVVEEYDGTFPRSPNELQNLTGVGPYTANAVASFAFNNGNAAVDTNVKRVLYRAFDVADDDDDFEDAANEMLPEGRSRQWNNAVMELGATVCSQTPDCGGCPWRDVCAAYASGDFTAPDVPTQPDFEGSRRQKRGRVIALLGEHDTLSIDELGVRLRADYSSEAHGDWLRALLDDLAEEGLVEWVDDESSSVRLQD